MKESRLYHILGIPRNLSDLLDKAEKEGEKNIHLIIEYSEVYESPINNNHWTEGYVNARYWHGRKKREVSLLRLDSRKKDYSSRELMIKRFEALVDVMGFKVGTVRTRKWKNRFPYLY